MLFRCWQTWVSPRSQ